ncbi:cyclin-dependent kinase C-2 [Tanacetum coccineum]
MLLSPSSFSAPVLKPDSFLLERGLESTKKWNLRRCPSYPSKGRERECERVDFSRMNSALFIGSEAGYGCDLISSSHLSSLSSVIFHGHKGNIYMVFEYMDHDLTGLADRHRMQFTIPQIKCYMRQLLIGLHYFHVKQVLHRDIKGSNLLIDNEGNLKLTDFGLARIYSSDHNGNLTNHVITLWYR